MGTNPESIGCPIWGTPADCIPASFDGQHLNSPRCGGEFKISRTAIAVLQNINADKKVALTLWLCKQRKLGVTCPEISSDTLEIVQNTAKPRIAEQCESVVDWFYATIQRIGGSLNLGEFGGNPQSPEVNLETQKLCAVCGAIDAREAIGLINFCISSGWINQLKFNNGFGYFNGIYSLTLVGIAAAEERIVGRSDNSRAFVAMWFANEMDEHYENGFAAAIVDAGYDPVRVDRTEHNNKIDDQIIAEIRRAKFIIADFTSEIVDRNNSEGIPYKDTHARGGVYFEAGFAKGLGKEVIWCVREDVMNAKVLHFDTRQFAHIVWKDSSDLKTKLSQRISATIGDGPKKIVS